MKYLKKKKHPILPWVIGALVLVGLILVLTLLPGADKPAQGDETTAPTGEVQPTQTADPTDGTASIDPTADTATEPTQVPTTEPTYAPKEDVQIQTPYITLYYPGEWGGLLQVDQISGNPHRVVFTARLDSGVQQELFTISFGGSAEGALGTVKNTYVHVTSVDFKPGANWTDNEISTIYAMQEALNQVLAGMNLQALQPVETQPETLPQEDDEDMAIDTPCGELHYPARWSEYLKLEIRQENVCSVEFYCALEGFADQLLFTIHFGGEEGFSVAEYTCTDGTTVELHVSISEIEENIDWTDAQRAIVYAMQEDMNYLLTKLAE